MFQDQILLMKSLCEFHKPIDLTLDGSFPNLGIRGGWILFGGVGTRVSLTGSLCGMSSEALTLKGVYISFLVSISDLSPSWAWVT